jgi:hypothetical protein
MIVIASGVKGLVSGCDPAPVAQVGRLHPRGGNHHVVATERPTRGRVVQPLHMEGLDDLAASSAWREGLSAGRAERTTTRRPSSRRPAGSPKIGSSRSLLP